MQAPAYGTYCNAGRSAAQWGARKGVMPGCTCTGVGVGGIERTSIPIVVRVLRLVDPTTSQEPNDAAGQLRPDRPSSQAAA